jgi:hypothetical protein
LLVTPDLRPGRHAIGLNHWKETTMLNDAAVARFQAVCAETSFNRVILDTRKPAKYPTE